METPFRFAHFHCHRQARTTPNGQMNQPFEPDAAIDLSTLNQRDETVPDPTPFDPLRLCVFTTVALIAAITGPLAVLYFALVAIVCYAKDRKSTRLNYSHVAISYDVFCLK